MRAIKILCILLFSAFYTNAENIPFLLERLTNTKDHNERYVLAKDVFEKVLISNVDSLPIVANRIVLEPDNASDKCNALFHHIMAEYYYELSDYFNSLKHRMEAIYLYENYEKTDELYLAKNYIGAGISSELLYMYTKALSYYDKAIVLVIKLNDKFMLAEIHSNKSFAYYGMGDFVAAIEQLQTALKIEHENHDTLGLAKDYNNLGFIYVDWGKYETGIEYYKKALDLSVQKNLKERIAICYNNIGMAYFQKGDYAFAENFILKALDIDLKNNNQLNVAKRYNNLALIYFHQNKTQLAISYFQKASKVFKEQNDDISYAKALINIFDIYLSQNNNVEAYKYLKKGYDVSLNTNSLPLIQHNTEKMYKYYKSLANYEKALYYKELHDDLSDSIYSLKSSRVVEELEMKYETEKKEDEIFRLNTESEFKETIIDQKNKQRNLMAAFVIFLLLGLSVIVFILLKIRKQRKRLLVLNNVKNRLFAMISHDLKGYSSVFQDSGMVIRHHLAKENYQRILDICESLELSAASYTSQLDNILNWALVQLSGYKLNPEKISPYTEINVLIENISDSRKLKANVFQNNIDELANIKLDKGAFSVIMRNLIINANKFTENGTITISMEFKENDCIFMISDTGVGMDEETKKYLFDDTVFKSNRGTKGEKGSGVGLSLVKTFVKLSGGTISVESEKDKGSCFIIKFDSVQIT